MSNDQIVKLNVGGRHFVTTRKTLCTVSDSKLARMFSEDSQEEHRLILDGEVFLDCNPAVFSLILNYLRGDRSVANTVDRTTLEQLRTDAYNFELYDLFIIADDAITFNRHYEEMREGLAEATLRRMQRARLDDQEAQEAMNNAEFLRRGEQGLGGPIDEAILLGIVTFGIFLGVIALFIANRTRLFDLLFPHLGLATSSSDPSKVDDGRS